MNEEEIYHKKDNILIIHDELNDEDERRSFISDLIKNDDEFYELIIEFLNER